MRYFLGMYTEMLLFVVPDVHFFLCVNGLSKSQRAAAVPKIQLTSVWPMLYAQTMKRALVRMGFIRMAVFAQPASVNYETL